ncbi:DMT family transporter [Oricola nitratireducens]|uniref:DMT family transporter n=1 Tax=Oricola nitratireducens TaxID=2775868 RepID=UPI001866E482|nr:DMT family transporter [Oricola nitratireducens]
MQSTPPTSLVKAALWMSGSVVSMAAMAIAGRSVQAELNTFELMAYRSVIGFVIVSAVIFFSRDGFGQVKTRKAGLHAARNIFHFTGQNLWFFAITVIPLAQVVALEFTNPIWVALLAPLMLGESMTRTRLIGAIIGFIGVLVVARPGIAPLDVGHFAALGAAIGFAMNTIFTKKLMRTDTTLCVLFWMTLSQGLMGFALAAPGGVTMFSLHLTPWVVMVGISGLSMHYCLTSALRHAPASIVAPMEFVRLPVIAVLGMLIYGEPLEIFVFVGGAIILAGNLVNITGERRARRLASATV